jgi:hypothetical protein
MALVMFALTSLALAQAPAGYNYQESKAGRYVLPDPLALGDGSSVSSPQDWKQLRRPQLLALFTEHVYGVAPDQPVAWTASQRSEEPAFDGDAVRVLVDLTLTCQRRSLTLPLLIYRPPGKGPFPVFLGMNFCGNQSVYPDPGIPLGKGWVSNADDLGIINNRANEESRGGRSVRWPVEAIVGRGYALCTLAYGDLEPDVAAGFGSGAHRLLGEGDSEWGAIAAWAWGLSRVGDFLDQEPWVDRMALIGHSRLGKAALWAGATDQRFGLVISNNSGCGGAALSRRDFGETVKAINESFPHWFVRRFHSYNGREAELPVDQHELLALMAGRNLYVASAQADLWADPEGERLAVEAARPVFSLVGGAVGYHRRPGKHNVTPYDWERFLDFADANWKKP